MKPHIVIAVQDPNCFFALGIKYVLQAYFMEKDYTWRFVPMTSNIRFDLMVCARPIDRSIRVNRLREYPEDRLPETILVQERPIACVEPEQLQQNEPDVLGRREKPEALIHLVERIVGRACFQPLEAIKKNSARRLKLTPRERDILQGFCRELTPCQIANALSLNVKTVSTHKLTAMRKLGFKRSSELYYWVRQGGLELESSTR